MLFAFFDRLWSVGVADWLRRNTTAVYGNHLVRILCRARRYEYIRFDNRMQDDKVPSASCWHVAVPRKRD